jgi:GT2 family glycosyltransferase
MSTVAESSASTGLAIDGLGLVVIGRNEGERLRRCFASVRTRIDCAVYVDSGSTDDSVANARSAGVQVVELDMSLPFTAARARNAGFAELLRLRPDVSLVQFLDGDMEVLAGWLDVATAFMRSHPEVVALSGVRKERHPDRNVYHRIADVEWRLGESGETNAFGGDVLMRADAFARVDGYDARVIAAEDNELALRLRLAGGKVWRIDQPCTLHDVAMSHPAQWWQRAKRTGYAYAQVHALHTGSHERAFAREYKRTLLWGALVPSAALGLALPTLGASLSLFGLYALQAAKVTRSTHAKGFSLEHSLAWGASCALSKLPESVGLAKFHLDRARSRTPRIIEHKRATKNGAAGNGQT